MKKTVLFLLAILILLPINSYAFTSKEDYVSMNLIETLESENIEKEFTNYSENDKQITIYMFRGQGCSFCKSFLKYLNSITDEYGKYFKLESYETWHDAKNDELMNEVGTFLNKPAKGVPYIIIGDEVFEGYIADFNEDIEDAIEDAYNEKNRYDVLEEMKKASSEESKPVSSSNNLIWNIIIAIVCTVSVIAVSVYQHKKINDRLDNIEKKLKHSKKEEK